jgi:molybdopterin molybdotransferase
MTGEPPQTTDVRMHGFARRSEVPAVLEWIGQHAIRLGAEMVPLDDAAGRILAADVVSPVDVPGFDRAAMDGYALRGAETSGASEYNPIDFPVHGQAMPGAPFAGVIPANAAIRIMTGAPVPAGVDAVVPAEYATESAGQIAITRPVAPGQHVGRRGEDIATGAAALAAGRRLRPQDVGLIASLGMARVAVVQRPRVRLLVTGNEVIAPGEPKGPYQIYDANSAMLRGLVSRDGGTLETHRRLGDDPKTIRAALQAAGADVILVSGGSSVGSEDYAPRSSPRSGSCPFMASRCGHPALRAWDVSGRARFPVARQSVSCLCAYDFFAGGP